MSNQKNGSNVYWLTIKIKNSSMKVYLFNLTINIFHKQSMDEKGDYEPTDAEGFIRINQMRLKESYKQQIHN